MSFPIRKRQVTCKTKQFKHNSMKSNKFPFQISFMRMQPMPLQINKEELKKKKVYFYSPAYLISIQDLTITGSTYIMCTLYYTMFENPTYLISSLPSNILLNLSILLIQKDVCFCQYASTHHCHIDVVGCSWKDLRIH